MTGQTKILTIDGGGMRGIIPASVIAEIERRCDGRPAAELFDVIAGTSTGGLIALGLAMPGPDGRPKHSAQAMVEFYDRYGPQIFRAPLWRRIWTLGGFTGVAYSGRSAMKALRQVFGEIELSKATCDVILTVYEMRRREALLLKSKAAREDPARFDCRMRDAARSTSSGPTLFPPFKLRLGLPDGDILSVVDGGLIANSPAMCAWADVKADPNRPDDVFIVSVGTGVETFEVKKKPFLGWGILGWASPLITILFDANSVVVDDQLRELLPADRYYRLDIPLNPPGAEEEIDENMDAADPGTRTQVHAKAAELISGADAELDKICAVLRG